jgi:hypothetical protein
MAVNGEVIRRWNLEDNFSAVVRISIMLSLEDTKPSQITIVADEWKYMLLGLEAYSEVDMIRPGDV